MLRLLVGSPLTLNLRNLVWHGFVFPGEISPIFATIIFLLLTSIGVMLEQSQVLVTKRKLVSLSKFRIIEENHPALNTSREELQVMAESSELFYKRNLPSLDRLLCSLETGRHGLACLQLLPLLETTLRKLFVTENNCPDRSLTAESETLYTTFTEILEKNLSTTGEENLGLTALGEDLLTLLFDILILPDGPRIRDKLGHGEVLFYLSQDDPIVNKEMEVIANHLLNILVIILGIHLPNRPMHGYQDYRSLFHPSTFLKTNLTINISELEEFYSVVKHHYQHFLPSKEETSQLDHPGIREDELKAYSALSSHIEKIKIKTLHRPRREYEAINLMTRISRSVSLIVQRGQDTVIEKTGLLHAKLLRSRQRATWSRMMASLPKLLAALFLLLGAIVEVLSDLEGTCRPKNDDFTLWKKRFKNILKICENISSNVTSEKNKWEEVESLVAELRLLISSPSVL